MELNQLAAVSGLICFLLLQSLFGKVESFHPSYSVKEILMLIFLDHHHSEDQKMMNSMNHSMVAQWQ